MKSVVATVRHSCWSVQRLRLSAHERRTPIVVTLIGFLLSLTATVTVLGGTPAHTADQQVHTSPAHDPAGLGVTGALSGDPLSSDTAASHATFTSPPSDLVEAGPPEPPDPHPVPAGVSADFVSAGPSGADAPHPIPGGVPGGPAGSGPPRIAVPPNLPDGPLGVPGVMLDAYERAARTLAATQPGCNLSWSILAGIGRIESGHASDGRVNAAGNTLGPILGPRLDGSPGIAAIPDTDHGVLDGDTVWDRAVGPMQFIPSSWRRWGVGSPTTSTTPASPQVDTCAPGELTSLNRPNCTQPSIDTTTRPPTSILCCDGSGLSDGCGPHALGAGTSTARHERQRRPARRS